MVKGPHKTSTLRLDGAHARSCQSTWNPGELDPYALNAFGLRM